VKSTKTRKLNFDTKKISNNIKASSKPAELKDDMMGLLAILTWLLPSSLLKLDGYLGLFASAFTTWFVGAAFDIKSLRRAALPLAGVQLAYTKLQPTINSAGITLWRMGGNEFEATPALPTGTGAGRLSGYNYNVPPSADYTRNAQVLHLDSGAVTARPASFPAATPAYTTPQQNSAVETMMGLRDGISLLPAKASNPNQGASLPYEIPAETRLLPGTSNLRNRL